MKTAICRVPVEIYDAGLTGRYEAGQVIDAARAERLLEKYPDYFTEQPSVGVE